MDNETLNGLGDKLASLDLTDAEQATLDEIIARAATAEPNHEVEGFGFTSTAGLNPMGIKLGVGLGRISGGGLGERFSGGGLGERISGGGLGERFSGGGLGER